MKLTTRQYTYIGVALLIIIVISVVLYFSLKSDFSNSSIRAERHNDSILYIIINSMFRPIRYINPNNPKLGTIGGTFHTNSNFSCYLIDISINALNRLIYRHEHCLNIFGNKHNQFSKIYSDCNMLVRDKYFSRFLRYQNPDILNMIRNNDSRRFINFRIFENQDNRPTFNILNNKILFTGYATLITSNSGMVTNKDVQIEIKFVYTPPSSLTLIHTDNIYDEIKHILNPKNNVSIPPIFGSVEILRIDFGTQWEGINRPCQHSGIKSATANRSQGDQCLWVNRPRSCRQRPEIAGYGCGEHCND